MFSQPFNSEWLGNGEGERFFRRDKSGRKGHTHKLFKTRVRLDVAKFSFGITKCEMWNHSLGDVVSSSSVNIFKGRLDDYLWTIGGFK